MDSIKIKSLATPDLKEPILVEGLPGTGLIGSFASEYLVEELNGQPVRRVYSEHFPPVVSVDDNKTARLDPHTMYALKAGEHDLLMLTGYAQAEDPVGQHRLTESVLDIAANFGVNEVFTLGGVVMSETAEDYEVVGATTEGSNYLKERLKGAGVSFQREEAPQKIGGLSGLLLGLGAYRGFATACILGTTNNRQPDPKSALGVLKILQEIFGFSVDLSSFSEKAEQIKISIVQKQDMLRHPQQNYQGDESLRYLG